MMVETVTSVHFDGVSSSIRFDRRIYDVEHSMEIFSEISGLSFVFDEGDLIVLIEDKDPSLLKMNTLNLCNLFLDRYLRK